MSRQHASLLIVGSVRYDSLKMSTVVDILPERERHIRELCRLESDDEAAEVWQEVVEAADFATCLPVDLSK